MNRIRFTIGLIMLMVGAIACGRARLAAKGLEPIGVIHEDAAIAMSWLEGAALDATGAREEVESMVKNLEAVVARSALAV